MSALLTALAFARHGHAVFPVNWPITKNGKALCSCGGDSRGKPCGKNAAKHPYGKLAPNGLLLATTETGIIKDWFGYKAPDANLGLCTDKLVVVDVDPRHGGDESWAAIERDNDVPLTWRPMTGGGGEHVIFACPEGVHVPCVVAEQMDDPPLGPGVDIRASGGYIVAPPSKHISGRSYVWSVDHDPADVRLAFAPQWLLDRLAAKRPSPAAGPGDTALPAALPSGFWATLTMGPITEYTD